MSHHSDSFLKRGPARSSAPGRPAIRGRAAARRARGSVLVEFALVSFALYLLLAGAVGFGRLMLYSQVAQDAARLGARELALTPLPAASTFEQALADPDVQDRIYSPDYLVIDLDDIPGGLTLDEYFATLPSVNQALRPVMISDNRIASLTQVGRRLLRYPGTLVTSGSAPSGFTVAIAQVVGRNGDGVETIRWLDVVEEVRTDRDSPVTGPFSIVAPTSDQGLVALRINIPFQAAGLTGFQAEGADPYAPNISNAIQAADGSVGQVNAAPGALVTGQSSNNAYGGTFGLGTQYALGEQVRPFRRLVVAQALFRREVFAEQSQ